MSQLVVRDRADLKKIRELFPDLHIFGIGVNPFLRAHVPAELQSLYTIIAFDKTQEIEQIQKDFNVITLRDIIGNESSKLKRNGNSVLKNQKIQAYIGKFSQVGILSYKGSEQMEEICKQKDWLYIAASKTIASYYFENKNIFRNIFPLKQYLPKSIQLPLSEFGYKEIVKQMGKKFVIQDPLSSGGKGTYFVSNRSEYAKVYRKIAKVTNMSNKYLLSEFISGIPASITGVATRWGVFSSNIQIQLQDIPFTNASIANSGVFNGHDWTISKEFPDKIQETAKDCVQELGKTMYQKGFKGYFGIDILINKEEEKLYVIECNPRLTGTLPTIDMIQERTNKISLSSLHILEFLADKYPNLSCDFNAIQSQLDGSKDGAHLLLFSPFSKKRTISFNVKPGVYVVENNKLKYKREGYQLKELNNTDEFILTEIVSQKQRVSKHERIARILSLDSLITSSYKLKKASKNIINLIYKEIKSV